MLTDRESRIDMFGCSSNEKCTCCCVVFVLVPCPPVTMRRVCLPCVTVAVTCATLEAAHASAFPAVRCDAGPSPFDAQAPHMVRGLGRRQVAERTLRQEIVALRPHFHSLVQEAKKMAREGQREAAEEQLRAAHAFVRERTEPLLFPGAKAGERDAYLAKYGCTECTKEAIKAVKRVGPIIEIGAGRGHWQKVLSKAGVDIVAFDDFSHIPALTAAYDGSNNEAVAAALAEYMVGKVKHGNQSEIAKHPKRTLLLCYPPPSPLAAACLELYKGKKLVYVGEGRGGCNANAKFFDVLQSDWEIEQEVKLKPFVGGLERLYVLRRK